MTASHLKISFILPVLNETYSLQQTVEQIVHLGADDLREILIVTAQRTSPASLAVIDTLKRTYPTYLRFHQQRLPFLGGALQEAFAVATGEHILLMASDLETDPALIPALIDRMKQGHWDIVAASRWQNGGGFQGYSQVKLALNYLFQRFFGRVYHTDLTDLTYAYRLYRTSVLQGISWEELKHPFLLECLLKPLLNGARATELPCHWQARTEGDSASSFIQTFAYLRTAIKIRLQPGFKHNKEQHHEGDCHDHYQPRHRGHRALRRPTRLASGRHRRPEDPQELSTPTRHLCQSSRAGKL
jgi:glycosyltransferase involved in cell wall biosynthesis